MGTILRVVVAILIIYLAFKILSGLLGLLVGVAIVACLYVGARKLLGGPDAR